MNEEFAEKDNRLFEYSEIKEILNNDFGQFINEHTYTPSQAIGALLEDSICMMKQYKDNYISVLALLSVISLQNNFIDDFVYERLEKILEDLEEYKYRLQSEFLIDKEYLENRLRKHDFTVISNEDYKKRVNILLGV